MNVAALIYHAAGAGTAASFAWIDPFAQKILHSLPVPRSPNLGLFPESDCCLVSYTEHSAAGTRREVVDVYRLSDWELRGRLPMDCRAHFNVAQRWTPFLPSRDPNLIYLYKARTLGDHLAEDYVCGLRLAELEFTGWSYRVPDCVAGWSLAAGTAQAQMLLVADGLEVGRLPARDLEQRLAFWLGPENGMGPTLSLGPRPRVHSDLGHARAILCARERPVSVVVCNDGLTHLIDPIDFRYRDRQQVSFAPGHAMPMFAAQIDPEGRLLYVGTAENEARRHGQAERLVVHDLDSARRQLEWILPEPFLHFALGGNGRYLFGGGLSGKLWVLDARSGRVKSQMRLDGLPRYIIPAERALAL
jgi:hypothetical protein